jgi:general secretion pathway protein D
LDELDIKYETNNGYRFMDKSSLVKQIINRLLLLLSCGLLLFTVSCETSDQLVKDKDSVKSKKKIKFPGLDNPEIKRGAAAEEIKVNNQSAKANKVIDLTAVVEKEQRHQHLIKDDKKLFLDRFLKGKSADEKIKADINFDGTSIIDVIPFFATILKFNYLIDPEVRGATTIFLDTEMSRREMWQLFVQVLRLSGAYCYIDGDVVNIIPFSKLPQQKRLAIGNAPDENSEALFYEFKNGSSKKVLLGIKPFLSKGASALDISRQNALLIIDTPSNIPKLYRLLKMLDVKTKNGWQRSVIYCRNISPSQIAKELEEIMPILGFPISDGKKPEPGAIILTSLDRLQVIVASAANQEALQELEKWIKLLDRSDTGEQERVYVYKVFNGKASELIQALSIIFNTEGTTMAASSKGASSGAKQFKASSSKRSGKEKKESKNESIFEVPVRIFADAVNNRLVIRTTPRTYAMVRALLTRLDTVPAQVLLQVMIAEVTLDNANNFGVEFSYKGYSTKTVNSLATNYKNMGPAGAAGNYGLSYLLENKNNKDTFMNLQALAGRTQVKVISSPQLLVKSHTEAKISIGDKVPIITSEITDTQSSTPNNTSLKREVQYQNTGIILNITPHVTKGNLIEIELEQIVSDAIPTTSSSIDSPTIQERVLKTAMSLRNGKTVIIGGLIREKSEDTLESLPMIIDIPFIRHLTGNTIKSTKRIEMLIFITGYIIQEDTELDRLITRYRKSVEILKKIQPLPKKTDETNDRSWLW